MTAASTRSRRRDLSDELAEIHEQYPRSANPDWRDQLCSTELMADILRDMLREGSVPVRRGQRPIPDFEEGVRRLRAMRGEDYATAPFPDAFRALVAGRSLRSVVARTGIEYTRVQRLMNASRPGRDGSRLQVAPTIPEMVCIAKAYGHEPTYFVEFRAQMIGALVQAQMEANPELSAKVLASSRG